uniref:Uncharacterized protein n=1 Tax=Gopherus agassizii TaxID=38772 RepID=A0A452J070_9SAUR
MLRQQRPGEVQLGTALYELVGYRQPSSALLPKQVHDKPEPAPEQQQGLGSARSGGSSKTEQKKEQQQLRRKINSRERKRMQELHPLAGQLAAGAQADHWGDERLRAQAAAGRAAPIRCAWLCAAHAGELEPPGQPAVRQQIPFAVPGGAAVQPAAFGRGSQPVHLRDLQVPSLHPLQPQPSRRAEPVLQVIAGAGRRDSGTGAGWGARPGTASSGLRSAGVFGALRAAGRNAGPGSWLPAGEGPLRAAQHRSVAQTWCVPEGACLQGPVFRAEPRRLQAAE